MCGIFAHMSKDQDSLDSAVEAERKRLREKRGPRKVVSERERAEIARSAQQAMQEAAQLRALTCSAILREAVTMLQAGGAAMLPIVSWDGDYLTGSKPKREGRGWILRFPHPAAPNKSDTIVLSARAKWDFSVGNVRTHSERIGWREFRAGIVRDQPYISLGRGGKLDHEIPTNLSIRIGGRDGYTETHSLSPDVLRAAVATGIARILEDD